MIVPTFRLRQIFGRDTPSVFSNYHQAVKTVGAGLRIVARIFGGIVEALEFTSDRFGLFVQWHPERMTEEHRRKIFSAFLKACTGL